MNLDGLTCDKSVETPDHISYMGKMVKRNPFTLYEYITISKAMWRWCLSPKNHRLKGENMVTLTIEGQLPNLNEYTKACRSNKFIGAKMKKAAEEIISAYIIQQLNGVHFENTVELSFRWYEPNKKRDLDNVCFAKKFILDALVSNGIIVADGWKGVFGFTDHFFVDSQNPRIEVDIREAGETNGKSRP